MRLNLGSGAYPLEGWTNVDQYAEADVRGDIRDLEFEDVTEVRMSHLLEHLSWRDTEPVLRMIRKWMRPQATLILEVPDMNEILALGTGHPLWFKYVYGDQSTPGEYHLAGFTPAMLRKTLATVGFRMIDIRRFKSVHPGREGMPCIEARATA